MRSTDSRPRLRHGQNQRPPRADLIRTCLPAEALFPVTVEPRHAENTAEWNMAGYRYYDKSTGYRVIRAYKGYSGDKAGTKVQLQNARAGY
jgi:hypothetical protein